MARRDTTAFAEFASARSTALLRAAYLMVGDESLAQDDLVAQREWLWDALQKLPPRQRAAIVLRFYEDLTEAQTADAMGCALGTVKSQTHEIRHDIHAFVSTADG
jgi:DNA-directed RNA polymerase specialized sigma24 family protein